MTIITFCKLSSKEIFLFLHIFVRRSLQERVHSEMKTCARLYYCQHIQPTVLIFQSALIVQLVLKAEHCIRFEIGRACVLFISEWIPTLRRLAGGLKHWSNFVFRIRGWVVELGKYTYITGFPIPFSARGGNGPTLRGGTQGGGIGQVEGGMPRETSRQ